MLSLAWHPGSFIFIENHSMGHFIICTSCHNQFYGAKTSAVVDRLRNLTRPRPRPCRLIDFYPSNGFKFIFIQRYARDFVGLVGILPLLSVYNGALHRSIILIERKWLIDWVTQDEINVLCDKMCHGLNYNLH